MNIKTQEGNGAKPGGEKQADASQEEGMAEGKATAAEECPDLPAPEPPTGKAPSGPASCLTAPSVAAIH